MKRFSLTWILMLAAFVANADNLENSDRLLCSTSTIQVCFEDGVCYDTNPWEANVPQFVVVDTKKMTISTTKASDENRSTPIRTLQREEGKIIFQGIEAERAFSFVIDEFTGLLTVAVSRDGMSVSVFGACTDANI
jgi:hypothetical protein